MSDLLCQSIDMGVPAVLRIREARHDDQIVVDPRKSASGRSVTGTVAKKHDECIGKPCRLEGWIREVDPLRDLPGRDSRGPAAVIIADDHRLNTYPQRCRLGRARILR